MSGKNYSHTFIRLSFFALVTLVAIGSISLLGFLFVPLVASLLISFLFEPMVNYFETKGFSRLKIIVSLCIGIVLMLAGTVYFVIPMIISEASNIQNSIPQYRATLQQVLASLEVFIANKFNYETPDLYELVTSKLAKYTRFDMKKMMSYVLNAFSVLAIIGIVPVITFFFLLDGHIIQKAFLRMIPNRYFEMFVVLIHNIARALQQFIRGQLIDALAVGVLTSIGMAAIGMPSFLIIGLIAGVGNLIPYLGPIIGFMPAIFVLFAAKGFSILMLVLIVGVFALVQFVEGTFIYPIAVGKSVDLHPLLVILGITIGGQVGGILGMLIAIPLISVVKVTIEVLHSNLKSYSII